MNWHLQISPFHWCKLLPIYYVNYYQSSLYLSLDFDMAKGEFDMLYLCAGGVEAMIFSFDKSTSLEGGGQKKNPEMIRGAFNKGNHHSPPRLDKL